MFRALSRRAVKAVPRPFRLSTGNSRRIHSVQLPYSGPPSYDTITRRFSSNIDPQAYFIRTRSQEARDRGEFVDIHDIGGIDPADYDILITDVNDEKLRGEIAEIVGIPYHAEATMEDANRVVEIGDCYLYGRKLRTIFPTVVAVDGRAHWVFFIVDIGSPLTYLSVQTSGLFGIKEEKMGPTTLKIAGHYHAVHRSPNHLNFADINLLGIDFCNAYNVSPLYDFENSRAKLYFGKGWKMVKESKL